MSSRLVVPSLALAASAAAAVTFGALSLAGPPASGSVDIRTDPPGASVFVDGGFRGVSPVTAHGLGPEPHAVRIEKADFRTLVTSFTVREKHGERVFRLSGAPRGALEVTSGPAGAEVFLDGRYRGVTPLRLEGLRAGPHLIAVEKANHRPWTGTVLVGLRRAQSSRGGTGDDGVAKVSCELTDRILEYLQKALADAPGEMPRYMELGHYHFILGDVENAVDVYRRGTILAMDRTTGLDVRLFEARKDNDREEMTRLEAERRAAKVRKKKLEQQIQRDVRSGTKEFRAAMEEAKRDVRARFPRSVAVALKEADAAGRRGDAARAAEIIERSLRILPGSARLWERLAAYRANLGDHNALMEALRRAFRYSGADAGVRVRLAQACLENAERFDGAARVGLFEMLAGELARAKPRGSRVQQRRHALLEYRANREAGRVGRAVRALKESLRNTDDAKAVDKLRAEARRWLEDVGENAPRGSARAEARVELKRF